MDALEKGLPPTPVNGPNGKIFRLPNKAEGLTTISQNEFIVIFDDDRITHANSPEQQGFHPRALHEAWMVKLQWMNAKNTKHNQ